jgi:hypothetical protein
MIKNGFGMIVWILAGFFSLVTIGCASVSNNASPTGGSTADFIRCEEPRPEVCTQAYVPVCGELTDGSRRTYSNACSACSDTNVSVYRLDPCL